VGKRWEVRLIGTGGQGMVTVSIILAEAAVAEGRNVVQSQNYGPEVRGGHSTSYVIASDDSILYPKIDSPNVMVIMSNRDYRPYLLTLAQDGILIINGEADPGSLPDRVYAVPITDIAHDKVRKPITANIVSLGVIVGMTGMVSQEAALEAVKPHVPAKALEVNKKAFALGVEAGEAALKKYRK
jgi:2-oxoglutarate ferredoxin oxidoreductase subunit gamma